MLFKNKKHFKLPHLNGIIHKQNKFQIFLLILQNLNLIFIFQKIKKKNNKNKKINQEKNNTILKLKYIV